jgi:hypothetical protein
MDMLREQAAFTCSPDMHAEWICGMDMHHGHAACMQCGHACRMEMQHEYAGWTSSIDATGTRLTEWISKFLFKKHAARAFSILNPQIREFFVSPLI